MSLLVLGMGVVALTLLITALASGIIERAPLSFPILFLGLGFLLGPAGWGVLQLEVHDAMLEVVAIISLSLVLFLDAVHLQIDELRADWYVPFLTLGPGTLLVIAGVAGVAYLSVRTTPLQSLLLGAILASTDPVVLRDVIRNQQIPRAVRRALSVEAGMNDLVVLPIVLTLIALLQTDGSGQRNWFMFLFQILVLSPVVGLVIGGAGAWLMGRADARFGIRREYQALYGIGLVLAAFTAGQVVEGDGFLAAFFAGLSITLFNVSLCDCFLDYGEVTAEMMMMVAFVLFGVVLSNLLGTIVLWPALILALIALFLMRPLSLWFVLLRAKMSPMARAFIGWFGPRGLNSLLLALLAVQGHVPGAEALLAITGVVVIVSVLAHGISATPLAAWYGRKVAEAWPTLQEERASDFPDLFEAEPTGITRINVEELASQLAGPQPPMVLDVRSRAAYETDDGQIPGSIRVPPDQIADWAVQQKPERAIVAYCTCANEAASARAARYLQGLGLQAVALDGGYPAWRSQYPIEAKGAYVGV
ncbi:MAG: cation:proton antiporter [Caldilineaceae bacterium]|nr:cation:proton antiporter [Caldilineaceae bacterium]